MQLKLVTKDCATLCDFLYLSFLWVSFSSNFEINSKPWKYTFFTMQSSSASCVWFVVCVIGFVLFFFFNLYIYKLVVLLLCSTLITLV